MCIRDRGSLLLSTKLFFFQAEDGIRDHAQSRGLGDVYKRQILDSIPTSQINFKGIIVVNGVTDPTIQEDALYDYLWGHQLYSIELRDMIETSCKIDPVSHRCKFAKARIDQVTWGINPYNIYGYCYVDPTLLSNRNESVPKNKHKLPYTPWARQNRATTDPSENSTNSPCFTDAPMDNYFNRLDVKRALNMPSDIVWRLCNDELYDTYVRDEKGSMEVYPKLFEAGIKILIVNGDADSVVNFNEFYIWGPHLGLKVIEDWKQWRVGDQVAGFITKYNNNLTFATVKGAGHQAPSSKRRETFELLTRFLNDQLQTIVFRAKTYFCPRSTAGEPDEIHGYHVCTL
eukprot:TRINITY_DN4347_c0_g2_i4.p1 TRINITY_DN4347_c0_g2~~TRINITY_DN4347_c0_g2_i4.p1  ORF type:complete len:344 (-),score=43.38 TRINITY_DN4347_c0_g2_i4:66-1097(-)